MGGVQRPLLLWDVSQLNTTLAHQQAGLDTLVFDLDTQNASLTWYMGDVEWRDDHDHACLSKALFFADDSKISDAIFQTESGFDVVARHANDDNFTTYEHQAKERARMENRVWEDNNQLREQLIQEDLHKEYDVIIADVSPHDASKLKHALVATQNVVVPMEDTLKGKQAVAGVGASIKQVADESIDPKFLSVVPYMVGHSNVSKCKGAAEIVAHDKYPSPVVIGSRPVLEKMQEHNCSVFELLENDDVETKPSHEATADRFDQWAAFLERVTDTSSRTVETDTSAFYERVGKLTPDATEQPAGGD